MSESPFVETEMVAGKCIVKGAKIRPVDGLWPIERVAIPQLAMLMFEKVTGRHPASADEAERDKWIKAMERVCDVLAAEDNVRLYP